MSDSNSSLRNVFSQLSSVTFAQLSVWYQKKLHNENHLYRHGQLYVVLLKFDYCCLLRIVWF